MPTDAQVATAYGRMIARCEERPGPLDTPCLVFTGAKDSKGYGRHNAGVSSESILCHRMAQWARHGDPGEMCVLHRCDNPPCVADDHLFLGTRVDNNIDMRAKGRGTKPPTRWGTDNHAARLDPEKVREVRRLAELGLTQKAIGAQVGVHQGTVSRILQRRYWAHVA